MRKIFLSFFLVLNLFTFAQVTVGELEKQIPLNALLADSNWLYNTTNNPNFYKKEISDSVWQKAKTSLYEKDVKKLNFTGFAWFRKHIFIDTTYKNTPLVLSISQEGASEIYFNGVLVKKIGKIGSSNGEEERNSGDNSPIFINPIYDADNVIAIKYSNKLYQHSYDGQGDIVAGFDVEINKNDVFFKSKIDLIVFTSVIGLGLFIFFATIGFIHFLLFLFYKERKSNLYFSIFCVLYGYYFLHSFLTNAIITTSGSVDILNLIVFMSIPFFSLLLITVLYSLFYPKFPKQHKVFLIIATGISLTLFLHNTTGYLLMFIFIAVILIEVIRTLIISLKNKVKGAKIIAAGFGLFCLFIFILLTASFINGHGISVHESNNVIGLLLITFFILSIVSIPISMSVFLAWDFSKTNKNLKQQLFKNEELSAQTIAQAKEKQELLANQNKLLEEQVTQRTLEINEQKKELQLKNVEITDSINYSKHIQLALLPEEEDIKNALPGSFILYQPKDIVSGDFYWFKEIDKSAFNHRHSSITHQQSSILIAAADCTGHGVPGALMSLIAIENLNKAVEYENEPHKILELVNKNIKNALKQNTDKAAKDGMDIALCKIEQISETNFKVSYSAANRPLWIVRTSAGSVSNTNNELVEVASINSASNLELIEIKATKTAIGGHTDYNQTFEQHTLEFKKGDSFYIFSDGYADQFGSDKNKKLTTKRFKEILLEINSLNPEQQKQHLLNYVLNWKGKLEQIDDILVIGLKF